jgi:hypothetical protein
MGWSATPAQLDETERRLYANVANGGFGTRLVGAVRFAVAHGTVAAS